MYDAHKNLGCTHESFDTIIELLVKAMRKFKVTENVIEEIGEVAETLRNDIVTV